MKNISPLLLLLVMMISQSHILVGGTPGASFYTERPNDTAAVYFTTEKFKIKADGRFDVTTELQRAIDELKQNKNFGIVFIPAGKYLISKTIYIPKAIRLIGYGKQRPEFILAANTPGFQKEPEGDKGKANYMFWFTARTLRADDTTVPDANAGTFYSALSNINIRIEKGNPAAIALRTHFAQHSFVAHCDIQIGEGKAGVFDVGNFMEDVRFFGGTYGILTTKASPGWQFMMLDTYFEGQRQAAIYTQEAGLTIVRMLAKNVPHVIEVKPDYWEKLFMEDCQFTDVKDAALVISNENNDLNQISLVNITCKNVPVLVQYRKRGNKTAGKGKMYNVKKFVYGLHIDGLHATPEYRTTSDVVELKNFPAPKPSDIPALPTMTEWFNVKDLGAIGDNEADDGDKIQKAINEHRVVYLPQGWYRITKPIKLKENTVLIGLNPIATQIIIHDNTPAFSGFGGPLPMLEAPKGGNSIITGIGISTGDYNARAVACKWMAGEKSYINDVKFLGGHGDMTRGPVTQQNWGNRGPQTKENRIRRAEDPAWDSQYWSLWVTNGGGGIFADIWTASTFASSGIYVNNTQTPGKIYAMSVEHHMRNEVRFNKVSNWNAYALQLEEEDREGRECVPIEIQESSNLRFANLYVFRTIRVKIPFPYAIRNWNSKDIEILNFHNYAQTKYSVSNSLYDVNTNAEVRPWEFARLYIDKPEKKTSENKVEKLASLGEFIDGSCADSKGNVYFSETRLRRIYKWSAEDQTVSMVADFPWQPQSLTCDSKDNLIVVFRYDPQPGYMVDGKQETFTNPPDANGTSFSGWGNSGFAIWAYSINPSSPEETVQKLSTQKMGSIKNIYKALYPSNRWRDYHDYNEVVMSKPTECFVAPDEKTIIPIVYDLARANALVEAFPGQPVYATNEYDKRIVRFDVDSEGYVSNPVYFVEKGEYSTAVDKKGNLYVADGNIYEFSPQGKQVDYIEIPERPTTITFGGKDRDQLFVTTAQGLYRVKR